MMTKEAGDGHRDAHTRGDLGDGAADLAGLDQDAAEAERVEQLHLAALIDGSPDVDAGDVLGATAELVARQRRARGRPLGSGNKRNGDMLRYLQALGHRDPLVTLSAIQTADTLQLAASLGHALRSRKGELILDQKGRPVIDGCDPLDVLKVQEAAARDLLPYVYAKRPVEVALPSGDQRPVMVIGQLNVAQVTEQLTMSAGMSPEDMQRFQRVTDGEAVRPTPDPSHDDSK